MFVLGFVATGWTPQLSIELVRQLSFFDIGRAGDGWITGRAHYVLGFAFTDDDDTAAGSGGCRGWRYSGTLDQIISMHGLIRCAGL